MNKLILFPYKIGSGGCKVLKTALKNQNVECLRVYANRKYKPRTNHVIVNWGNSVQPTWERSRQTRNVRLLNDYNAVRLASNKLSTFRALFDSSVQIPLFTTDINVASSWFDDQGVTKVFCRTLLNSKGGKGIVIATSKEELVPAPLYTEGISSERKEYRVQVAGGEVIDVSQKLRKNTPNLQEGERVDPDIRSHDRGWVYARNSISYPEQVKQSSVNAVAILGLDFGAVDITSVYSEGELVGSYVLEVNTAPGLEEGSTATNRYLEYFNRLLGNNYNDDENTITGSTNTESSTRIDPLIRVFDEHATFTSIPAISNNNDNNGS